MLAVVEEVRPHAVFHAVEQALYEPVVSTDGNALVGVVEVVVVEDEAYGQPSDDEGRQLWAFPPPLLLGISFDEPFVNVASDEGECLLFQVAWLGDACRFHGFQCLLALLFYLGHGGLRSGDTPHLVEGVHVEGQVVEFPLVVGYRRVGVSVERGDGVDEVPHFLVGGVEDVGAINVYVDSFHFFAIHIATQVWTLVNHKAFLAFLVGEVGESGSEETRTHDEVVVFFHKLLLKAIS